MLESLAEGFRKHILDSDPSKLAKQLGLIGKESGADNPAAEVARRLSRSAAMVDMKRLIRTYGLGQLCSRCTPFGHSPVMLTFL